MPRTLKTTIVAGLLVVSTLVLVGVSAVVWVRARSEARSQLEGMLHARALLMVGLLDITPDGVEFDLDASTLPEYGRGAVGAYAAIYAPDGRPLVRSPSLGDEDLPRTGEWQAGAFAESDGHGPGDTPCALTTYSFIAHAERAQGDWTPPPEEARRYQIVVAADSRPRDAALRSLALFLVGVGAAATALVAMGGFAVASVVLRPVRVMTQSAASLDPQDTTGRLLVPDVVPELRKLAESFNSALDRIADSVDRRRRFVANASHELRTPLAVLLGNAELALRRERSGDEYRRALERQRRVASRLAAMTESLLFLARADDSRAVVAMAPVSLSTTIREVCDELLPLAADAGVTLHVSTDHELVVDGEAAYLAALVQNLVANGIRFSPRGATVHVSGTVRSASAVLTVEDKGDGIAPEALARLFERFSRVKDGADPREGAGLGLAITQWIAKKHGGTVRATSEVGAGAVFTVELPLSVVPASKRQGVAPA